MKYLLNLAFCIFMISPLSAYLDDAVFDSDEFISQRWSYMQQLTPVNGPNCWNSALFLSGIVDEVKHTSAPEFTDHIESEFCEEVESPELGDVVVIRSTNKDKSYFSELHAYTYYDEELGYTKNGFHKNNLYEVMSHKRILQKYRALNRKDCRIYDIPAEYCLLSVQYFRCQ